MEVNKDIVELKQKLATTLKKIEYILDYNYI